MSVPPATAGRSRLASLLILSLTLAACGTKGDFGASPTTAPTTPGATAGFPVTIEHKHGTTEIPEPPERVVTLGYTEQNPVLALGVVPVAVREWFGEQPNALWPWAQDELGSAEPEHPEFDSATVAWASPAEGTGQYWAVGPSTPPMRFLASLGLQVPDNLAQVIGDKDSAQISREQVGLLDADVLILQAASPEQRTAITSGPLYQQLDVAREGRVIFFIGLDDPIYGALSFSSVLSLPFALDQLVPQLAAAVDGNPATNADRGGIS